MRNVIAASGGGKVSGVVIHRKKIGRNVAPIRRHSKGDRRGPDVAFDHAGARGRQSEKKQRWRCAAEFKGTNIAVIDAGETPLVEHRTGINKRVAAGIHQAIELGDGVRLRRPAIVSQWAEVHVGDGDHVRTTAAGSVRRGAALVIGKGAKAVGNGV